MSGRLEAAIAAIDVPFTAAVAYLTYEGASWAYEQATKDSKDK